MEKRTTHIDHLQAQLTILATEKRNIEEDLSILAGIKNHIETRGDKQEALLEHIKSSDSAVKEAAVPLYVGMLIEAIKSYEIPAENIYDASDPVARHVINEFIVPDVLRQKEETTTTYQSSLEIKQKIIQNKLKRQANSQVAQADVPLSVPETQISPDAIVRGPRAEFNILCSQRRNNGSETETLQVLNMRLATHHLPRYTSAELLQLQKGSTTEQGIVFSGKEADYLFLIRQHNLDPQIHPFESFLPVKKGKTPKAYATLYENGTSSTVNGDEGAHIEVQLTTTEPEELPENRREAIKWMRKFITQKLQLEPAQTEEMVQNFLHTLETDHSRLYNQGSWSSRKENGKIKINAGIVDHIERVIKRYRRAKLRQPEFRHLQPHKGHR